MSCKIKNLLSYFQQNGVLYLYDTINLGHFDPSIKVNEIKTSRPPAKDITSPAGPRPAPGPPLHARNTSAYQAGTSCSGAPTTAPFDVEL